MSENKISKILKYLGGFFIGISVILLLISLFSNTTYLTIAVSGVISGIIKDIIKEDSQNEKDKKKLTASIGFKFIIAFCAK